MDGGAWYAAVHGGAKSRTRLSDFTFTFRVHALEKEMATHSSVLAWGIPGTAEPGGLPSLGLHRVGHERSDLAAAAGHLGSPHISDIMIFVFLCQTSLSMTVSRSIHVAPKAANGIILCFLWLSDIPLCVCIHVYIYIHIYIYTH